MASREIFENMDILIRKGVQLRNPFRVTRLPFLSRLQRAAFRHRRRVSKRFIGKPAKLIFRLVHDALRIAGTGVFELQTCHGPRRIKFSARNTQYGSIFLPQYRHGYEPEVTALLDIIIENDAVFLDIGSNWGFYSLFIASKHDFCGRIYAFEPFPPTFDDLRNVVAQSGLEDRITCHSTALSDRAGHARMIVPGGTLSGLARIQEGDSGTEVVVDRLDNIVSDAPSVIKIDVEDLEANVLLGGESTIKLSKPFIVFENWKTLHSPDITIRPFRILEEWGYCFFVIGWLDGSPEWPFVTTELPEGNHHNRSLALVNISPDHRFLLEDQLNILAVHSNSLSRLKLAVED